MKSIPVTVNYTVGETMRYCDDIGLWAIDRSIPESCVHATEVCKKDCFNEKLYRIYPDMRGKDVKNEIAWANMTGKDFRESFARKKKGNKSRFRLMTRGESFSTLEDVHRVKDLISSNPDQVFWVPTRAWRDQSILIAILRDIMPLSNARVLASMDSSNTTQEWRYIKALNISTMYFDKNKAPTDTPTGDRFFRCPKTHKHLKGHCSICKAGCFNNKKRVDVHLLQH